MDIRNMECFIEIARHKNFSKVAERLEWFDHRTKENDNYLISNKGDGIY